MSEGLSLTLRQEAPIPLDARLDCAAGELLALVGPSGGGKSTVLKCIAGLHRPQSGRIACNGETWLDTAKGIDLPPQRRSVGFVFQSYALFPHLSARHNVSAALGHLARRQRGERAEALLAMVHLDGLGHRRPAELSGGQQQRVALARALARDPALLLLDESFSAVDQVTRRKLQRELAQLRRTLNIPIVLVTHDLDEAQVLADRMCILHRGRTLQAGPPFEVLARPRDATVARLVGLSNLFDGVVAAHDAGTATTLVEVLGRRLEARHAPGFAIGERVSVLVPASHVVLHRRDRPSRGEHENPLAGIVSDCVVLGETMSLTMLVDGAQLPLSFAIPTHVARRNAIALGERIGVSLLKDGLHLMPAAELGKGQVR